MILTSEAINSSVGNGRIIIEPYSTQCLNPNSYNFHLGAELEVYTNEVLDPKVEQPTTGITIPPEGYVLQPHQLYLGHTQETIGSNHFVPMIYARSSIARLGLFVQITAPLGDIGFVGRWTLQLTPVLPIRVYAGMRVGQVLFLAVTGEIELYNGKYQHAQHSRKSEIYKDFKG